MATPLNNYIFTYLYIVKINEHKSIIWFWFTFLCNMKVEKESDYLKATHRTCGSLNLLDAFCWLVLEQRKKFGTPAYSCRFFIFDVFHRWDSEMPLGLGQPPGISFGLICLAHLFNRIRLSGAMVTAIWNKNCALPHPSATQSFLWLTLQVYRYLRNLLPVGSGEPELRELVTKKFRSVMKKLTYF